MKKLWSLGAAMFIVVSLFAQQQPLPQTLDSMDYANKVIGKVVVIGDTWIIESNENGSLQRYVPESKDESWKVEVMELVFSGIIGKSDPNVRMMGNPLELQEWRRLYRASPAEE